MKEKTIDLACGLQIVIQEHPLHVDVLVHRRTEDGKVLLPRAYMPGGNSLRFFLPGGPIDDLSPTPKEVRRANGRNKT